jgi:hypothetical protein
MWKLLLIFGAGLGLYSLMSDEEKEKKEISKKDEEELNWKESVLQVIDKEGLDNALTDDYIEIKKIKNLAFQNAVKNYKEKRKELNYEISKLYKPKRDYVKMIIDKEGFEYTFDGYSNFDEYENNGIDKPFTDKEFHKARKEYVKAINRINNLINN